MTNSLRHANLGSDGWIGLKVEPQPGRVRVEVSDPGPGFVPSPHRPSVYQESGWGLFLVGRIADRWGVIHDHTTRVWFEIDCAEGDPS